MGFRLYGDSQRDPRNLDYSGSIAAYLGSATLQRSTFEKYCRQNNVLFTVGELIQDAAKRARFAETYNGPANVSEYSTRLLAAIRAGSTALPPA